MVIDVSYDNDDLRSDLGRAMCLFIAMFILAIMSQR